MAATRVLWLVKGLGPGGAEHLLVGAAGAHDRERFALECAFLLPWKDALVGDLEAAGVAVECFGVRDERDLRWARDLRRRLADRPVDVLHAHSPYPAAVARLVARTLPRRVRPALVSTEHNAWSTFRPPTRYANAVTAPLDDAVLAVSEEVRESMWPLVRRRAEVLAHGVPLEVVRAEGAHRDEVRAELGVGPDVVLVGTVANYHPKKDWPTLLRAARQVADRGAPVRFCAVGQGPLAAEVEALHSELGLDDVVVLTGYRPDAVRLMGGCDLFCLSSRWEGLPVALMEALALGLPVVATAVGGVAETLHDDVDARLVPPGRPDLLAGAIVELAADAAARRRLGSAAAARAAEFDVARAVRRIEEVYDEVRAR